MNNIFIKLKPKLIPKNRNGSKINFIKGDNPFNLFLKKGNKIHIKKENRGKFTEYCGGKVTEECIRRGKNSSNPVIRKRATFASNVRKWKHQNGGKFINVWLKNIGQL